MKTTIVRALPAILLCLTACGGEAGKRATVNDEELKPAVPSNNVAGSNLTFDCGNSSVTGTAGAFSCFFVNSEGGAITSDIKFVDATLVTGGQERSLALTSDGVASNGSPIMKISLEITGITIEGSKIVVHCTENGTPFTKTIDLEALYNKLTGK